MDSSEEEVNEHTRLLSSQSNRMDDKTQTVIDNSERSSLQSWLQGISLPLYILIVCFALSSWIDINGLWVEIPILVNELPEGWNLPSYIIVIIQFANIGPLMYTVLVGLWPRKIKEWPAVYVIISIGALSCLALVFFWDYTSVVNGKEHSTGLFILTFFLALVDCTSSVVYLPYMAIFKPQYMTSFYIGEGLSGLIPGLVGLMQGLGGDTQCVNTSVIIHNKTTGINETEWEIIPVYKEPNFSVEIFFFFLFCMILTSAFAFTCIHFMPFAKKQRVSPYGIYEVRRVSFSESNFYTVDNETTEGTYQKVSGETDRDVTLCKVDVNAEDDAVETSTSKLTSKIVAPSLSMTHFIYLLILTAWINGLTNGVLPSTQSYTCLPYSGLAYSLTVRLSTLANPLACFIALFLPLQSITTVSVLTGLGSILSIYQLVLAGLSPSPPLQDHVMGEILVVLTAVLLTTCFTFSKVTIASILRDEGGRTALIWCGAVTQIGSFIGAIVIFLIVNVFQLLESMPPCPI